MRVSQRSSMGDGCPSSSASHLELGKITNRAVRFIYSRYDKALPISYRRWYDTRAITAYELTYVDNAVRSLASGFNLSVPG